MIVALLGGATIGWFARAARSSASPGFAGELESERTTVETGERAGEPPSERADVSTTASAADSPPRLHADDIAGALQHAVDQIELAVIIYDAEHVEVHRNRAAMALVGTHAGVIVGGHLDEMLLEHTGTEPVERSVELHGPPRQELVLRSARMVDGGSVAIIDDVSERKRVDAMRTDFVTNISHELKTPVGAIAVLADALDGERDLSTIERMSQRIVDEAHRAVGTIDDLLELSRIEVGGVGSDVVDLGEVVAAAVARGRAVDHAVSVTALNSPEPIQVIADRRQLVSAVGNLVENAVKYSDGGGEVQIRTRIDDRNIEVMVADEGVGIPQRDLYRVFERFYRVDRSRRRETGGTGLGLAIVRHVATNHGGDVIVESAEGEGSTFVLRLPASLVVEDQRGANVTKEDA